MEASPTTNIGANPGGGRGQCRTEYLSRIQVLVDSIQPALERVDPRLESEQQLEAAVTKNVWRTMQAILESPEGQALA